MSDKSIDIASRQRRNRNPNRAQRPKKSQLVTKEQVRSMIKSYTSVDVETKYFYSTFSGSATSTSATTCLSSITQGIASNQRTGDKALVKSLEFKVGFNGGDATNYVRLIFFRWLMNDASDTVQLADVVANAVVPWLSLLSPYKPNRFEAIYDEVCAIGTSGTDACIMSGKLQLNSPISFNATAATGIGHIYVMVISDSTAVAHPTYAVEASVGYTDE